MPQTQKSNQSKTVPPPDPQQIASTNETVNMFLGGRTRSWMTGGSVAVTNPTPGPVASSNSRKRIRKRKASDTDTVLLTRNQNDNAIQRNNILSDQSLKQQPGDEELTRASTVLPSPALTDAPSPNVSNQADCTNPATNFHVEGAAPWRPVSDSNMNQGDLIHVATSTSYPNHTAAISHQPESSSSRNTNATGAASLYTATSFALTDRVPHSAASPQVNTDARQQNISASREPSARTHTRPYVANEHQAKRVRVHEASGPEESRDHRICIQWFNAIERQVANAAQAGLLNETVEKPRYRILAEACQNGDFFYIAFHQALCAWSLNKGPIHVLFHGLVEQALLDAAFDTAQTILRKNEHMSTAHLQWFANFPTSIADFSRVFPNTAAARDISAFLIQLASTWRTLSQNVLVRGYPLLAYELSGVLCCRARGLQSMLFTMSRRSLGIADSPVAVSMNEIFEKDRDDEALYAARGETPENLQNARETVAKKQKELVMAFQKQQQQQQQVASNTTSSPAFGQSTSMAEQRSRPSIAAHSPHTTHAAASSPSLTHFDVSSTRPLIGGSRVASPASVNNSLPSPGNNGDQGPRRPNALHVQTDTTVVSPPSAVYPPPRIPQLPLPRSSSAGLHRIHSNHGSPVTAPSLTLPSNRQLRTPILPSNNSLLQRRATSFAYPSQALPSNSGTHMENQAMYPQPAGFQNAVSPVSTMHPPQHQVMSAQQTQQTHQINQTYQTQQTQQTQQRRASASQYNITTATSPNHAYPAQPMGLRIPPYRIPVTDYPGPPTRPIAQIPEAEYPSSPYGHGSLQVGLQHVGVRSPRRVPFNPGKSRYYQFVRQLVYQPVALEPRTGLRSLPFNVSEDHIQRLTRKIEGNGLPFCHYSEGSYRYRLRICMQPETKPDPSESDWVISATSWPNHIFFDINQKCLELRRKQHFSKDQPLELTDFLVQGENILRVSFPAVEQNLKPGYKCFMAIEIVETISHDAVHNVIQSLRHIPAEETRDKIQRRIRPPDSDDLIIEDDTLTISLADPFSATRCVVPVRGSRCKHLECFDLDTWLQTRPQKPTQKGGGSQQKGDEPSMADAWKCPICGLDARPVSLWVDEYLAGVRKSLLGNGDMRTKSIVVTADGKWSAVLEPDDSDDDSPAPQSRDTVNGDAGKHSRPSVATPTNVIEILDDD
ncbi:Ff.00g072020.m01.CDS01 [Fusarium sp. VM40]|nr:Ff.00g072020.m01.CDS01 [Fusarium sp. VM40]